MFFRQLHRNTSFYETFFVVVVVSMNQEGDPIDLIKLTILTVKNSFLVDGGLHSKNIKKYCCRVAHPVLILSRVCWQL